MQGRITGEQIRPVDHNNVLACRIADSTGDLTAVFYGRPPGLELGSRIRLRGVTSVGSDGRRTMINPCYELLP